MQSFASKSATEAIEDDLCSISDDDLCSIPDDGEIATPDFRDDTSITTSDLRSIGLGLRKPNTSVRRRLLDDASKFGRRGKAKAGLKGTGKAKSKHPGMIGADTQFAGYAPDIKRHTDSANIGDRPMIVKADVKDVSATRTQ